MMHPASSLVKLEGTDGVHYPYTTRVSALRFTTSALINHQPLLITVVEPLLITVVAGTIRFLTPTAKEV